MPVSAFVGDIYLPIPDQFFCAERIQLLVGVVDRHDQQNARFVALVSLAVQFEANTSNFSLISTVSLCLQYRLLRCRDVEIWRFLC